MSWSAGEEVRNEVNRNTKERTFLLTLMNVLHIPGNRTNLFALGRWEQDGRKYSACDGILLLNTHNGTLVAQGTRIQNNLYKLNITTRQSDTHQKLDKSIILSAAEPKQTWEV